MRSALLVLSLTVGTACAPTVDGPSERQQAVDREDSGHLAAALAQLPGAVRAEATLHRPAHDPLAGDRPGSAAILVIVDDRADRAAVAAAAERLVRGVAPEIVAPAVVVEVGAVRPVLARVGPFEVEASSRGPLVAALATALGSIAALAGWLAWRERWRLTRPT